MLSKMSSSRLSAPVEYKRLGLALCLCLGCILLTFKPILGFLQGWARRAQLLSQTPSRLPCTRLSARRLLRPPTSPTLPPSC